MFSLLLSLSAFAAEPDPVDVGWFHNDRRELTEMRSAAHQALAQDATNYGAHRLNAYAHRSMGELDAYNATVGTWHEAENSPASAIAVAAGIAVSRAEDKTGCDTLVELLDGLPGEADVQYIAGRIRLDASRRCELDADQIRTVLTDAPPDNADAFGYSVQLRSKGAITEDTLADIDRVLTEQPSRARGISSGLWAKDRDVDANVKAARKQLTSKAKEWAGTDDAMLVHYAAQIYRTAKSKKAQATRERATELMPITAAPGRVMSEAMGKVFEANQRPTHELALADLDALAPKIKDDPEAMTNLQYFRAMRLTELGREQEAIAAMKAQLIDMEDPGNAGNGWAYEASLRGEDLDDALSIIEASIAGLENRHWDPSDPYAGTFSDWRESRQQTIHNYEDTRGWILYLLGRYPEAVEALTKAANAGEGSGVVYAHLGLSHLAADQGDLAFAFLGLAFAEGIEEPELEAQSKAAFEPLFIANGPWHPDGIDGYLGTLQAPEGPPAEGQGEALVERGPQKHSLIGQALPIDIAKAMDGGDLTLQHDGILVIDLWATWCGPCVQGMPHLQEVAKKYADNGVRVVGLSVDDKQAKVTKFFRGATVDYDLGWISQTGFKTFDIDGIPSLFVVNGDGVVTNYISGYGSGDSRLDDALDVLLAENSPKDD